MITPPFPGELWRHVDALGEPVDSAKATIARELARDTTAVTHDADGITSVTFWLTGETAYPRPSALIAGLTAGSSREQVRAMIGNPTDAADEFAVEGGRVRCTFVDDGLSAITLARYERAPQPRGEIEAFLHVLGEPEEGVAFQRIASRAGGANRRWLASPSIPRRQLVFGGAVEVYVAEDRVLGTRILLDSAGTSPAYGRASTLLAGLQLPAS